MKDESDPVSVVWEADYCTVSLTDFDNGVQTVAAGYDKYGRPLQAEFLTAESPTAVLTGNCVKVFFLQKDSYMPIRKPIEMMKP